MASEKTKTRNIYCHVPFCGANKKNRPDLYFFTLPKDLDRAQLWLKRICLPFQDGRVIVCEDHFDQTSLTKNQGHRKKLLSCAVPTKNLPMLPTTAAETETLYVCSPPEPKTVPLPMIENMDIKIEDSYELFTDPVKDTNTTQEINIINIESVQKTQPPRNVMKENTSMISRNDELRGMIKGASTFNLKIHSLQMQIQELLQSRGVYNYKQLSLKLYLRFPKVYNVLQKAISAAPKSELKDVFKNTIIANETSTTFPIFLAHKANAMTMKQKQCVICIGEIEVKPRIYYEIRRDHLIGIHDFDDVLKTEPAKTAVVIIAQGIYEEWKQPIAVGFLGSNPPSIKPWVDKNIRNLTDNGYNVRAVVSHVSTFNIQNHIYYMFGGKKIYFLYDISSLLTSLYYSFTKYDYDYNKGVAKYQHIVDYFEYDSKRRMPLTPTLTDKHIKPTNFQDLRIQSVMEVFSMQTAAAMSTYIDFNILEQSAQDTINLMIIMRKLYDFSKTGRLGDQVNNNKVLTGDKTHIAFLTDMIAFFNTLKRAKPKANSLIPVDGWKHRLLMEKIKNTLKSIITLSETLKSDNFEEFPVWRLTTNSTEFFYEQVRKHSKSITKPTARDVDFIFRQTAIIDLLKCPKRTTPIQIENVLREYELIVNGFKPLTDCGSPALDNINYIISSSVYNALEIERQDGIIFLAGFLLNQCNTVHKCDKLKRHINRAANDLEALSMCESIMPDVWKNVCVVPSAEFIEFVESMEILFRTFIYKEFLTTINKKILNSLLKCLEMAQVPLLCQCFPIYYVKKLYARFRIYHTLKYNNELLKTKRNNTQRIVVNKL